mgnify:FL=1|tara:strand:+ start:1402 stop:2514 length:1113 start_codon:yes stop_codon:yes gene_type:complete
MAAFAQTLRDFGRHATNLNKTLVDEILPEHFRQDYPNLITFLDAYYEHLDSADNFGGVIEELQTLRDIEDAKLEYLDLLFDEIGLGISQGQFVTPREVIRNFGNFFRVKGSEYSIHGFFRAFFNEEIEIFHPKDSLFIVGQSRVGTEDAKKIQDGRLFQVFSTLIKGPIPLVIWEALYRKYVHPSGFYLGANVVLEAEPRVPITTVASIPFINPNINVFGSAALVYDPEGEVVGALRGFRITPDAGIAKTISGYRAAFDGLDGQDSDQINNEAMLYMNRGFVVDGYVGGDRERFYLRDRYNLSRTIKKFQNMTIAELEGYYSSMYEMGGYWVSFDDKTDSAGTTSNNVPLSSVKFSSTNDTFDARSYFRQ